MLWLTEIERRKYFRIPCKIDIKIRNPSYDIVTNSRSRNISHQGLQVLLDKKFQPYEQIEILPDSNYITNPVKSKKIYKAEVRWIKPNPFFSQRYKYLVGLKIFDYIDWKLPISRIETKALPLSIQLFSRILSLVDDKLILFNTRLEPIWINRNHDWNFLNISGKTPIEILLNLKIHSKVLKNFIFDLIEYNKYNTILIPSFNLIAYNRNRINIPFNLFIIPLIFNTKELNYILMRINLKNQFNLSEHMTWLDYRYLHIGRVLENMLEEIVNPISAAMGRLELLTLKLDCVKDHSLNIKNTTNIILNISSEIQNIKDNLRQISYICSSTLKNRNRTSNISDNLNIFSLSDLIRKEVNHIKLQKPFKDINIELILDNNLPKIYGNYELWALAIKTLCQNLQKKMRHCKNKQITIETFIKFNKIFIKVIHTGKEIRKNLLYEHELSSIFQFLLKEYPLKIYIDRILGHQTILIELSLIVDINNININSQQKEKYIN